MRGRYRDVWMWRSRPGRRTIPSDRRRKRCGGSREASAAGRGGRYRSGQAHVSEWPSRVHVGDIKKKAVWVQGHGMACDGPGLAPTSAPPPNVELDLPSTLIPSPGRRGRRPRARPQPFRVAGVWSCRVGMRSEVAAVWVAELCAVSISMPPCQVGEAPSAARTCHRLPALQAHTKSSASYASELPTCGLLRRPMCKPVDARSRDSTTANHGYTSVVAA